MSGLIVIDDFEPVRHRLRMYIEARGETLPSLCFGLL
jgi:hypothetical protein